MTTTKNKSAVDKNNGKKSVSKVENGLVDDASKNVEVVNLLNEQIELFKEAVSKVELAESEDESGTLLLKIGEILADFEVESEKVDGEKKKSFVQLKKRVAEDLGMKDYCNINKVVKIARNPNIKKFKDRLPKGWGALSVLTQIQDDNLFAKLMEDDSVTSSITRRELTLKVKALKPKKPSSKSVPKTETETDVQVEQGSVQTLKGDIVIRNVKADRPIDGDLLKMLEKSLTELGFKIITSNETLDEPKSV
jgi:hypothetical protein